MRKKPKTLPRKILHFFTIEIWTFLFQNCFEINFGLQEVVKLKKHTKKRFFFFPLSCFFLVGRIKVKFKYTYFILEWAYGLRNGNTKNLNSLTTTQNPMKAINKFLRF